jgi:hypothetical protein
MAEDTPPLEVQRATVDLLFEDVTTFEQELFLVEKDSDLRDVMYEVAWAIMEHPKAKATVNFATLKRYDGFRFEGVIVALKEQMESDLGYLITQEAGFDAIVAEEVRHDPDKQAFLLTRAKDYVTRYQTYFKEAITDSFFDRVESGDREGMSPIIQEAIDGAGRYRPVFVQKNGASLARKADQVLMRIKQARFEKKKKIAAVKEDVQRLTRQVRGIERNLQAIEKAKNFTLEELKRYTMDTLKEVVVNEGGQFTEEKRLLQFVPAGEMALYLADQMDRGRRNSRNDVQRGEYKRATAFYENCNVNNTEKELANKIATLQADLPHKNEALTRAKERLNRIERSGLHHFDEGLMKMRQTFLENLGQTRI